MSTTAAFACHKKESHTSDAGHKTAAHAKEHCCTKSKSTKNPFANSINEVKIVTANVLMVALFWRFTIRLSKALEFVPLQSKKTINQ